MRKTKLAESFPVEAGRYLVDPQQRARFAEVLSPAETAAHIAASSHHLVHHGWAIRIELAAEELELLAHEGRANLLQLDVVQFSPGLPVAVLRTLTEGVEFRFGVPLWQSGAQEWLLDAVEQGQLLLLLDPPNGDFGIALRGFGNLLSDRLSLISAATLTREPGAKESQHEMVLAGLKLLEDQSAMPRLPGPTPFAIRTAVAGQGKSALAVMGALMTAETARVAAMGRDEELALEGHAGTGPLG